MLIKSTSIMSNPIISITSSSDSKESPITTEYLTEVIREDINKLSETNALIEFLLSKLQKKSSKHKFLIQATRLKSPSLIETNLNILTSFGAVWDSNRDGYVCLKVELKGENGKEEENYGELTKKPKEKILDEQINDNLNNEVDQNEEIEEHTLEAGPNDKFNSDDVKKDLLDTTDIKADTEDDLKTGEDNYVKLEDKSGTAELEDDDKVSEDVNNLEGLEDHEEALNEELGTTEPEIKDDLKDDVVDSEKLEHMGHVSEKSSLENKDTKELPNLKDEIDSGNDIILVSIYWVFVD